ncbi:lysosomal cholesterol signaling protein-like [Halichondria panicea]|uniref:lysosomal cholesterol signaling protein-like n=1 Tax=Halichondria panicea TaxID=6063 RepID=UPI00312B9766
MVEMSGPSVDSLFPAIAQSFVVIAIGYGFGFFKLISPKESKSIGTLIGNLFLPALLFKNLAILNLSAVSWPFLGGMLLAKFSVFLAVALLTMILTRQVGTAGLFGIFATQSNDFALGLPIVTAVYGESTGMGDMFDYTSYIYLLAIVSLAMINPIGFVLMEYNKQSRDSNKKMSCDRISIILFRTMKGVVLNPIIFMTVLGIVVNVIIFFGVNKGEGNSSDNLPDWLVGFLDVLGGAYAACALFNIGLFMVGKLGKVTGSLLLVATLLIAAKTIILPLIAYRVLYSILPEGVFNSSQEAVSTFGFLLGTFPTAPTVFVFSTQYSLAMEIVAASVVLCTFFSAPIMYLSARMILVLSSVTSDNYNNVIMDSRNDVSIVSCVSVAFVFILFLLARRYRSFVHVFVMHLMVAMLVEVIGVYMLTTVTAQHLVYWEFFWFSIFFIGVLSTRTWMASMAVGLLILIIKGPQKAEKSWVPLMLLSWGIPILITVLLVAVCSVTQFEAHKHLRMVDISFLFGEPQLILSLVVLVASFIIGFVCVMIIILSARKKKSRRGKQWPMEEKKSNFESSVTSVVQRHPGTSLNSGDSLGSSMNASGGTTPLLTAGKSPSYGATPTDSSKTVDFDSPHNSFDNSMAERNPLIQKPREASPEPDQSEYSFSLPIQSLGLWHKDKSGQHLMRFIVLILFLLFSSLVGILILIWKLSSPLVTGIFIAVNVLDTVTNFGQGFFILAVFGFEKHWFWVALYKKLRRLFFKVEVVDLPREEDVEVSVLDLCKTFNQNHKELCIADIVSNKKFLLRTYDTVFSGVDLVDWLVRKGVVKDREAGVQYGESLLVGRVVAHVSNEHYFHDEPYFYRFCDQKN